MTADELHELLRVNRPQYGYDFTQPFDATSHEHRDALRAALGEMQPSRSYPDAITDPVDPPTVSGTEVTRPLP